MLAHTCAARCLLRCLCPPYPAKLKLATLVQYVPLPVVGGYLGYVGYFCLAAGVGLGTSTHIEGFATWTALLAKGEGCWLGASANHVRDRTVAV
jgi:hypothetical protein